MDYGYYQQDEAYGSQGLEATGYSQAYLKGSQPQAGTSVAVAVGKADKGHGESTGAGKVPLPPPSRPLRPPSLPPATDHLWLSSLCFAKELRHHWSPAYQA